jgi:enamine deaminase RidA (YjgF/YER057c/UK114 family)
MVERNNMFSALRWESIIGYSRVVKYGQQIFISGTTSIDEKGIVVGAGDVYLQTKNIIQIIEKSLKKTNANLTNIVRTRMFVTNIQEWESIGKAHAEYFKDIQPASTMVEVKSLIRPELLVEIEADAIL